MVFEYSSPPKMWFMCSIFEEFFTLDRLWSESFSWKESFDLGISAKNSDWRQHLVW